MNWLDVLMQWLHLTAAATLVGAVIVARLVVFPSIAEASPDARIRLLSSFVARMRPIWFTVIGVLLGTGIYGIMTHIAGKPREYHMALGIKLLLALHIFGVLFVLSTPPGVNPARDARRP